VAELLRAEERESVLQELSDNGWTLMDRRDAIRKTFRFKSFASAIGWMTMISLFSEKINHHPEWTNVYNRVDVTLSTHSSRGL